MSKNFKEILSRGDTVGGKQVQNDEVRDCHAIARNDGEHGRSMVEMLGVLAIIGVLSVAGIAGYTNAMRNYRANEIVNAVAKLYVLGQAQNQGNGDQELPYTTIDTKLPSGVSALKYNADKSISITITDEDDYAIVKNKLGDKASKDTSGSNYSLKIGFEEPTGTENTKESCIAEGKYWLEPSNDDYREHQSGCYDSTDDVFEECLRGRWVDRDSCDNHVCECISE